MIKGIDTDIGGTVYTVPPLSLGAVERFQDRLAAPTGSDIIDITLAALKRNYPDLTRDELAEQIDVENVQRVIEAVMQISNLVPKAGEARPAGRRPRR